MVMVMVMEMGLGCCAVRRCRALDVMGLVVCVWVG